MIADKPLLDPKAWADAAKDILNWTAPLLPIRLGWILIAAGILFAAYKFMALILRRRG